MPKRVRISRAIASAGLVVGLATVAGGLLAAPALAANYGNSVNNCYGVWWTTDWNQECQWPVGAREDGNYRTIADCTAPQVTDESVTIYRHQGSLDSVDGDDCNFGLNSATTWYW